MQAPEPEHPMNRKLALFASTAIATAALAAPADAGNFYVKMFGGGNWVADAGFTAISPTDTSDTMTWSVGGDAGWIVGGAVGYDLNDIMRGWSTEIEVSYRSNQNNGQWASTTGGGGSSGAVDFDNTSLAVMANAWYEFPIAGISPYIGGGIGWARTRFKGTYDAIAPESFDFKEDGFAWQLGAGVNIPVKPGMTVGLGYRYFRGPQVTVESYGTVAGGPTNEATSTVDSENHSVILDLKVSM